MKKAAVFLIALLFTSVPAGAFNFYITPQTSVDYAWYSLGDRVFNNSAPEFGLSFGVEVETRYFGFLSFKSGLKYRWLRVSTWHIGMTEPLPYGYEYEYNRKDTMHLLEVPALTGLSFEMNRSFYFFVDAGLLAALAVSTEYRNVSFFESESQYNTNGVMPLQSPFMLGWTVRAGLMQEKSPGFVTVALSYSAYYSAGNDFDRIMDVEFTLGYTVKIF